MLEVLALTHYYICLGCHFIPGGQSNIEGVSCRDLWPFCTGSADSQFALETFLLRSILWAIAWWTVQAYHLCLCCGKCCNVSPAQAVSCQHQCWANTGPMLALHCPKVATQTGEWYVHGSLALQPFCMRQECVPGCREGQSRRKAQQ